MNKKELLQDLAEVPMDAEIEIFSNPVIKWEILSAYPSDDRKRFYIDIERTEK